MNSPGICFANPENDKDNCEILRVGHPDKPGDNGPAREVTCIFQDSALLYPGVFQNGVGVR